MTLDGTDDLIFVYIGTQNYHFMINKNIQLLRRLYPNAPVIVYDWGDDGGRPSGTVFPKGIEVIDWSKRVLDTWRFMDVYSEARRIEIGKTYNSRMASSFSKRLTKFFLKRFPNSGTARRAVERGLRYENLLIHKSHNLQECSNRLAGKRFILMDADAYAVGPLDEMFDSAPDIVLPMLDPSKHRWDYNNCHALSTGIVGFGANTAARRAFLEEWYDAVAVNDEWLRELAAMNRMILAKDPDFFGDWGTKAVPFGDQLTKIRTVENDVYNSVYNYQDKPVDMSRTKILHLAGIAQRPALFTEYIGYVEAELERRMNA